MSWLMRSTKVVLGELRSGNLRFTGDIVSMGHWPSKAQECRTQF